MKQKTFLILGAGRSSFNLIEYFSAAAIAGSYDVILIDRQATMTISNIRAGAVRSVDGDVTDRDFRQRWIKQAEIVISMLPARFHFMVAEDCLAFGKNLVTASYVSEEMESMNDSVREAGLIFLNEMGLDPRH